MPQPAHSSPVGIVYGDFLRLRQLEDALFEYELRVGVSHGWNDFTRGCPSLECGICSLAALDNLQA